MTTTLLQKPVTAADYIEQMLGYRFRDESLLHQALKQPTTNLRSSTKKGDKLELVGDGALDLIIVEECLEREPEYGVGQLSEVKSALTCNNTLAVIAIKKNLHLVLQQKFPASQESVLQAYVDQQVENGHLFSH